MTHFLRELLCTNQPSANLALQPPLEAVQTETVEAVETIRVVAETVGIIPVVRLAALTPGRYSEGSENGGETVPGFDKD